MGGLRYFKLAYFDCINESGGSHLLRRKTSFKPNLIAGFNKVDKRLKRFTGKHLAQLKKYIHRSQLVYMDMCRKGKYHRLITSWPQGKSEPTYWITNLDREKLVAGI